jgi:hypothetical protein
VGEGSIREQVSELVGIATLAEGVLAESEEHRIVKIAIAGGLTPIEAREAIDAALAARSARRAVRPPDPPIPEPPPPPPEPSLEESEWRLLEDPVARVIARRMGKKKDHWSSATRGAKPPEREKAEPAKAAELAKAAEVAKAAEAAKAAEPAKPAEPDEEEPIVAELAPEPAPAAPPAASVCTACLANVPEDEIARNVAERLSDGRVHCRRCLSKLMAGNMCSECYRPVARTELKSGSALARGGRAIHRACAPPEPLPAALTVAPDDDDAPGRGTLLPLPGGILGSSSTHAALGGKSPEKLGAKCAGCYVALPTVWFKEGRAVAVKGETYCAACAKRFDRGE